MSMWHNTGSVVKPNAQTGYQDRELLIAAIRANAEQIVRRIEQNTEPVTGAIRVRVICERIEG